MKTILTLPAVPENLRTADNRFQQRYRVDPETGCWPWTGSLVWGYGQFYFEGRPHRAHRIAWRLYRGPIPDHLNVLHRCDNPPCVNPDHLFLGTQADNHADMVAKGRMRVARGERHRNAKLTARRVAAMRLMGADGFTPTELARVFGVSLGAVRSVLARESWKHVPEEVVA